MTPRRTQSQEKRKVNHWLMPAPVRSANQFTGRRRPKPLPRRFPM